MARLAGAILGLLLLSGCAADPIRPADWQVGTIREAGGAPAILVFANGKEMETGLYRPRLVGQLWAARKAPFLVLAGRDCLHCAQAEAIYIGSPSDGALSRREGGPFPGDQHDADTNEPAFSSRLFLGRCAGSDEELAVWYYRSREKSGAWTSGAYLIRTGGDRLDSHDYYGTAAEAPGVPRLEASLAAVAAGRCVEVQGYPQALE